MSILVFATGGHARTVCHDAAACGHLVDGFVDEHAQARSPVDGVVVVVPSGLPPAVGGRAAFVAIGDPAARRRLMDEMARRGWSLPPLVHPSAVVAPDVALEAGVLIAAGAIVETGCRVGRGAVVDIGARIDHDCSIGAYCHVRACGTIAPRTKIEEARHVG